MSDNRQTIIDRIRKLLALATSPNEHEALAAAEMAQALLAKYNLEMSDIGGVDDPTIHDNDMLTDRASWVKALLSEVAKLYMCGYFSTSYPAWWIKQNNLGAGNKKLLAGGHAHIYLKHSFVGTQANVIVAKAIGIYLIDTMQQLCAADVLNYPKEERLKARYAFMKACTVRLCARLKERRRATASNASATGTTNLPALMPLYLQAQQRYEEWKEASSIKFKRGTKMPTIVDHAGGAAAGWKAGDKIGLNQQVAGGKAVPQLGV